MKKDAGIFVKGMAITYIAIGFCTLAPPISVNAAQTAGVTASIESLLTDKTNEQDDSVVQPMSTNSLSIQTNISFSDETAQNANVMSSILNGVVANHTTSQIDVQALEAAADVSNNAICGYMNLGITNVKEYLNIHKKAGEDQDLVGQLPNNAGCEILETKDDWCKIQSGEVTGWVKAEYLLTGDAAANRAKEVMTVKATATTDGINMREEPNIDSDVQATLDEGNTVKVTENLGEWVKIATQENESYVSTDLINISESLPIARTIEDIEAEEDARREAEEDARRKAEEKRKAEEAKRKAEEKRKQKEQKQKEVEEAHKQKISHKQKSTKKKHKQNVSKDVSKTRTALVDYALQFVGNPYVWGGTSLTNGVDCSGFTMKVYAKYGISLPHHAASQAGYGKRINSSQMRPGDLLFYSNGGGINHVALYIGKGKVVHASNPKTGIKISSYNYRTPVKIISLLK